MKVLLYYKIIFKDHSMLSINVD